MNKIKKLIMALINSAKNRLKNEINNFFEKYSDTSTKYFDIYMCITFSCFISGIIWIYLGQHPAYSGSDPNIFREVIGQVFIMLWFTCLLQISPEKIEYAAKKTAYSFCALSFTCYTCVYWKNTADVSSFRAKDILISSVSLVAFPYSLYIIKELVRIIFISIRKLINKILPAHGQQKSRLLYILESITSLFLAISSCLGGLWGIITMVKNFK